MKYAIAAALLLPLAASANSPTGATVRKSAAIALKKEVLSVSRTLVSVDDEFVNESGADVEESMVFPLPAYPVAGEIRYAARDKLASFVNKVNGKPVPYQTVVRAFANGTDVTPQLRRLGLSDTQMTYQFSGDNAATATPAPLLNSSQRQQLEKLKLFGPKGNKGPSPLWEAQVSYVWQQKFPANKKLRISQTYQPFVGTWILDKAATMDKNTIQRYCADPAFLKSWKKLATQATPESEPFLPAHTVGYSFERSHRWKNGIEDFTLNLVKRDPSELVSLCFPGTVKKINAKTFQSRMRNFQPTSDLDVYFGNIATAAPPAKGGR